jgi:hypothetical protein
MPRHQAAGVCRTEGGYGSSTGKHRRPQSVTWNGVSHRRIADYELLTAAENSAPARCRIPSSEIARSEGQGTGAEIHARPAKTR